MWEGHSNYVTWEIPVGVAPELPYPMVLGRECPDTYDILKTMRAWEKYQAGLLGEENTETVNEEDEALFNLEELTSGAQFREAQRQEPTFQVMWETETAKKTQQVMRPELCGRLPRCEVKNELLCQIRKGQRGGE